MSVLIELKPPQGFSDIPENTVWIHSPVLCKEYENALGIAEFASEELAREIFPKRNNKAVLSGYSIEEIEFEEARQVAKSLVDNNGNQIVAVHLHTDSLSHPSLTHWVR